jgi:hypothetical protein
LHHCDFTGAAALMATREPYYFRSGDLPAQFGSWETE